MTIRHCRTGLHGLFLHCNTRRRTSPLKTGLPGSERRVATIRGNMLRIRHAAKAAQETECRIPYYYTAGAGGGLHTVWIKAWDRGRPILFHAPDDNRADYQQYFGLAKIFLMKSLGLMTVEMYLCAPIFPQP